MKSNEEIRAAYSQFRLDYNDYLNSEAPQEEKEDMFELPVGINVIWASGDVNAVPLDPAERRYFTFFGA
jgi:hypothetical protein